MSNPFVGEIRIFAGNYAPAGWAFCDGSSQSIAENNVLFALIGTTYGGNGQTTFNLPDLRSRLPIHQGQGPGLTNFLLGQPGGVEQVTLTSSQIPSHTHAFNAKNNTADLISPQGNMLGVSSNTNVFFSDTPNVTMNNAMLSSAGGNQAHSNIQPYLCVNFIISFFGVFPQQP
jgi:microcystin-dependent protein